MDIRINIDLNGVLDKKISQIILTENTTIKEMIDNLGIDDNMIGIITVNGTRAMEDYKLCDGDDVIFISPILGG